MKRVLVSIAVVGLSAATGCAALQREPDTAERHAVTLFEDQVGDDLARLTPTLEGVAVMASELGGRDEPGCAPTFGDCSLCSDLTGDPWAGDASLTFADACTGTTTAEGRALTYEVVASELSVGWEGDDPGTYILDGVGSRVAFAELAGADEPDRWTLSWTLDRLSASTVEGDVDYLAVSMTYPAFEGFAWAVDVAGDVSSIAGTASHDEGGMCSILGTWDDVRVDCDLLGARR